MSDQTIDCYILPASPLPMLLPKDCIAEVVGEPHIDQLSEAPANWMQGHVNWQTQRLPVMLYGALHDPELEVSTAEGAKLVVLNPIPNAARKAYSGLLCHGDVQQISLEPNLEFSDLPEGLDKRYVDAVIKLGGKEFLVPKLSALGVAFSYF